MRSPIPLPPRRLLAPLLVLVASLAVFAALGRGGAGPAGAASSGTRAPFVGPQASTDERISALQQGLRTRDRPAAYAELGSAYLQKVRETGDAGLYAQAEAAFRRALREAPADPAATVGLGTLALARHDFSRALELGRKARRLAPDAVSPFPVLVDALVELGDYPAAGRALQELVDRKPGLPAYARISYFRELHGDLRGADQAMALAASAGAAAPEGLAYVKSLQGTLDFNQGELARAAGAFRAALRAQPSSAPAAVGLAKVAAARGDERAAIDGLRAVVDRLPLPEYVTLLGETELAAGRGAEARDDLALVPVERRLLAANGVDTDVELALYEADHGDPAAGVGLARRAWASAPSVRSADALGWALTRAGRPAEGRPWARRALRLGWREPLALYHAGMGARAAGDRASAKRLLGRLVRQAPRFSPLFGPRARRALRELR